MPPTEIALDALCVAMLASFVRANRLLAAMPLPADALAGGPEWSDSGAGRIPWQQFYSRQRLTLASAELMMACYVRRKAITGPAILSTQPPAWWRRLGRAYATLEIRLVVADGVCTPHFLVSQGERTPRAPGSAAALRLTLSPQQLAQLAELHPETLAAWRGDSVLTRVLRWLRRLTGTVTK